MQDFGRNMDKVGLVQLLLVALFVVMAGVMLTTSSGIATALLLSGSSWKETNFKVGCHKTQRRHGNFSRVGAHHHPHPETSLGEQTMLRHGIGRMVLVAV